MYMYIANVHVQLSTVGASKIVNIHCTVGHWMFLL